MNASDSLQLYADAFQQLASISAVLGGLAFTAAAANVAVGAVSHDRFSFEEGGKNHYCQCHDCSRLPRSCGRLWLPMC